jgi:purine-binding chemotaxis protein CheW
MVIFNLSDCVVDIAVNVVADVRALKDDQICEIPSLVSSIDTKKIVGLAMEDSQMLILVDIEQLMSDQELALIDSVAVH